MTGPEPVTYEAVQAHLESRVDRVVDRLRADYTTGKHSIEFVNGMEAAAALVGCRRSGLHNCVAGIWRNHDHLNDEPEINA